MKHTNIWCIVLATTVLSACSVSPQRKSENEFERDAVTRLNDLSADQSPVTGPIDLYEAMARALKYNLDYKVEVLELALRERELDVSKIQMLPDLMASANYSDRTNQPGGRSLSLLTGTESLEASTSSSKDQLSYDLNLSWNILDFGLSYIRAKQGADQVLIADETRRRVANRIIEDVRTAYWRAVSSSKLLAKLEQLEQLVDDALSSSRKLESSSSSSPLLALQYQRELLSVKLQITTLHRDFAVAKKQLAALMNINPEQAYTLVIPEHHELQLPEDMNVQDWVMGALSQRTEIRELIYKSRITERETTAALLSMLPGIELYTGLNYDTNDLVYNNHWQNWGARVGWNLLDVFSYPAKKKKVEAELVMLEEQTMAMAMAIVTQVHISLQRFKLQSNEFKVSNQYFNIQDKIDEKITASKNANRVSVQKWIQERMNTIVSSLKSDIAYAGLQNVYANVYASIGHNAFPDNANGNESVEELSQLLENHWENR